MKTTAELKAVYGDPLLYYITESSYEWVEDDRWLRKITKIRTEDGEFHQVAWVDRGHTDEANDFIHDEWVDEEGQHYERGPFA